MVLFDTTILTGKLAPASLAGYQQDLTAYLRFCGTPDAALEAANLARWCVHLAQATPLSPHTINRKLSAIKRLVREAALQGYLDHATAEAFRRVPGVALKAMKERLKRPTRLTPAQMRRLCDAPQRTTLPGWRDRALLHTLASSGCRVSEAITLTPAQIQSEAGDFFLSIVGKNQVEPRLVPLAHEAYGAIEAWLARRPVESSTIFTSVTGKGHHSTARPLDRSAALRVVQRYGRVIGLPRLSPQDMRRFVGTELTKRYGIRVAQLVLGHARIETTARHYVLDELAGGLTDGLY